MLFDTLKNPRGPRREATLDTQVRSDARYRRKRLLILFVAAVLCHTWYNPPGPGLAGLTKALLLSTFAGSQVVGYSVLCLLILRESQAWIATVRLVGVPSYNTLRSHRRASKHTRRREV